MDTKSASASTRLSAQPKAYTLQLKRFNTKEGVHPFDEITWVKRDAVIGSMEQKDVEFPDFWSQNAINITVSKYFRGTVGKDDRETSLKQMITRVTSEIRKWGLAGGYFADAAEADLFEAELAYLLVHQHASPNSPVWFNVGTKEKPQCSACFILQVDDTLVSILDWIRTEGVIFNGGSGSGTSISRIRSKEERLSRGGKSSGPVSFMRGADAMAGMIKSGGTTRRAAKMVVMNINHPDIEDFINCKANEEDKIRALMEAGYNMSNLNDPAWESIQYQNANNSVRVTDDFMRAVENDGEFSTHWIVNGEVAKTYKARDLFRQIAAAAWKSGDPGLQCHDIINDWHTCPNTGPIEASNPCSEYMHINNSACNLASINLMKYLDTDGTFRTTAFTHAVRTFILAQEITVGASSYPTPEITQNSYDYRQLGLGYANLGALLMTKGYAYDSEEGQAWCSAITSLMTGEAYRFSSKIARRVGTFAGYEKNREPMLRVMRKHRDAASKIPAEIIDDADLAAAAVTVWDQVVTSGEEHGFRNAQATVIAPTGTISFLMDCATTGIEPAFSLVSFKQLVGGGYMKLVNEAVPEALRRLGYTEAQTTAIADYIVEQGTIEGAPGFKTEHLPIFDCAVAPANGVRSISWQGHVKMVAAAQPFVSGAISKTFNMPHETTVEEIEEAYMMSWKLGIKAFAVYRDGSKAAQPLSTGKKKNDAPAAKKDETPAERVAATPLPTSARRKLPVTRASETHKFSVAGHEGYITTGLYEDGTPGELFIKVSRSGSTLAGLLDSFAIATSMAIQYGVPLKALCAKFIYTRFEPAGFTENPDIRTATSIADYVFRYLALRHLNANDLFDLGVEPAKANQAAAPIVAKDDLAPPTHVIEVEVDPIAPVAATPVLAEAKPAMRISETVCKKCGGMMVRTGSCQTCLYCGESSGGC